MAARVQHSSGNVFKDLGFSEEEAENLKIRADLMIELSKLIEAQDLTQAAATKLLGVTQPRVSDLMRGKIDRFSGPGGPARPRAGGARSPRRR